MRKVRRVSCREHDGLPTGLPEAGNLILARLPGLRRGSEDPPGRPGLRWGLRRKLAELLADPLRGHPA
jgi:hypothetical protein